VGTFYDLGGHDAHGGYFESGPAADINDGEGFDLLKIVGKECVNHIYAKIEC
jgi:hypothetical protein